MTKLFFVVVFKKTSQQTQTHTNFPASFSFSQIYSQIHFVSCLVLCFVWLCAEKSKREGPCQRGHIWEGCMLGCLFRSATTAPSPSHHLPVPPLLLCSSLACIHQCQPTALSRLNDTALQCTGTQSGCVFKTYTSGTQANS